MTDEFDTVVVGGRCAGAAAALLLARGGLRVLVLEAGRAGTDTLSTHALMRGAVEQLHRWGLLDKVIAAGTPAIAATEFHYTDDTGTDVDVVETRPGVAPLRAPRRTVLDPILVAAARAAGAEIRHGARVTGLLRDAADAVTGVTYTARGRIGRAHAPLVVGADGRRSAIAAAVDAPLTRRGQAASAFLYTYRSGVAGDRYRWFYRPGTTAGVIPTNDGQACVWVGVPAARFDALRTDLEAGYRRLLAHAAPRLDLDGARQHGPVRGFPGLPGYLRRAAGPGWALVGDAGYFKDPVTAHGITDALRDAELLARAVLVASPGPARDAALRGYEDTRDQLSEPLFALTDRIASYGWDLAELRDLLPALSAAMRPEVAELRELGAPVLGVGPRPIVRDRQVTGRDGQRVPMIRRAERPHPWRVADADARST
jgi:flavin-dependent dehydrogenase